MVQRLDPSVFMQKADDGDYVAYEDYEKLAEANKIYLDCLKDTMKRLLKSKCPHALAAIMWIEQALDEAKQALKEAEKQ